MTNQRNRSSAESGFEPKFSFLSRLAKFETGPGDAEAESDLGGETRARVQRTVRTEKTKKTGFGLKQKNQNLGRPKFWFFVRLSASVQREIRAKESCSVNVKIRNLIAMHQVC